jgi:Protein of unknown function (DUF4239)
MLTLWQDALIFVAVTVASLFFMGALNWIWPQQKRSVNNDLIGWQLTTVGTAYAVILGFMLYTTWTTYGEAQLNSDLEASALRDIYRLADGLPEPQKIQLKQQARAYADSVVNIDWPTMARGEAPEGSHTINEDMWKTVLSVKSATPAEAVAEDHALTELGSLTEHRRTRVLQSVYKLPAIFWAVLIVGGCVTILSAATFGARSTILHAFQVMSFTMLVTLVLLAIGDVNLPFQGWVHVSNYAFVRAQQYMTD